MQRVNQAKVGRTHGGNTYLTGGTRVRMSVTRQKFHHSTCKLSMRKNWMVTKTLGLTLSHNP